MAIFVAVYRNVLRTGKSNRKLLFIGNIPRGVFCERRKRVAENGVNSNNRKRLEKSKISDV